jgi:hypothetical protein
MALCKVFEQRKWRAPIKTVALIIMIMSGCVEGELGGAYKTKINEFPETKHVSSSGPSSINSRKLHVLKSLIKNLRQNYIAIAEVL